MIFLQAATDLSGFSAGALAGGVVAAIMGMVAFFAFVSVLAWVYMSFVFMAIGKKANYSMPGLAWIPSVGPLLIASKTAGMHWWPILLLAGMWIPIIGPILSLVLAVFSIIWMWKTFEVLGRPGWWAILLIVPILNFVMLGIAAWGEGGSQKPNSKK